MYGHVGSHRTLTDVPLYYITLLKATINIFRHTDFRRKYLDDTIKWRTTYLRTEVLQIIILPL